MLVNTDAQAAAELLRGGTFMRPTHNGAGFFMLLLRLMEAQPNVKLLSV